VFTFLRRRRKIEKNGSYGDGEEQTEKDEPKNNVHK